ncbi:MAG TPA: hypothetical protein VFU95_10580 [Telluria sp.]|nr:hypothetical protein [Telluria sp.]
MLALARKILVGGSLAMLALGGSAQEVISMEGQSWTEAGSLAELPAGVQASLGAAKSFDDGGIADRGGKFNPGCILTKGEARRRFVRGAFNANTVVVLVESGGRGHSYTTLEWRLNGTQWEAWPRRPAFGRPKSLQELLQVQPARSD